MSVNLRPRQRIGQWSLAMASAVLLLLIVRSAFMQLSGSDDAGYFFSNPPVEILNILIWLCGSAAFLTGVGDLTGRSRSLTALVSAALGFAIFLYGVIHMMAPP